MARSVREMRLDEVGLIIDYFHTAVPGALDVMGIDPTRLLEPEAWRAEFARELARPVAQRRLHPLVWLADGVAVGFSAAERIVFGREAYMHMHVIAPDRRQHGHGAAFVRQSADNYFATFGLQHLYCEPNAFNVAPNRTLQRAGFVYERTYVAAAGTLNFRQAVTRWRLDRDALQA